MLLATRTFAFTLTISVGALLLASAIVVSPFLLSGLPIFVFLSETFFVFGFLALALALLPIQFLFSFSLRLLICLNILPALVDFILAEFS